MGDNEGYQNLATELKCVHKLWKARVAGYEEATKLFNSIDNEKSPKWNKYLGLIKKFVTDSNPLGQEKGLEAALVFVQKCGHAGKNTKDVMAGIVQKCFTAPKARTRDLALQLTLVYVEIGKHVAVQDELIKGLEQKNPKVVAGCIAALTTALNQFGNEVIGVLPIAKMVPLLLADREKAVREKTKALVVEMHRWIGASLEPHIAGLPQRLQQELRSAFGSGGARPTRQLRSNQATDCAAHSKDCGNGAAAAEAPGGATGAAADRAKAPLRGAIGLVKDKRTKEAAQRAVMKVPVPAAKKRVKPKTAPKAKPTAGCSRQSLAAGQTPPSVRVSKRLTHWAPQKVRRPMLPADFILGLTDAKWKTRLSAVHTFHSFVESIRSSGYTAESLLKMLITKPGLKDTNLTVLKAKMQLTRCITDSFTLSRAAVDSVLQDIVSHLGEPSCSAVCAECLTSLAEGQGLAAVGGAAFRFAMEHQTSPRVQAQVLGWLSEALAKFGPNLEVEALIPNLKKALSTTSQMGVRSSAVRFIGLLELHAGPGIQARFDAEAPLIKEMISCEGRKHAHSTPATQRQAPVPERDVEDLPEPSVPRRPRGKPRLSSIETLKDIDKSDTWEPGGLDYGAVLLRLHHSYKADPPSGYWRMNENIDGKPYITSAASPTSLQHRARLGALPTRTQTTEMLRLRRTWSAVRGRT